MHILTAQFTVNANFSICFTACFSDILFAVQYPTTPEDFRMLKTTINRVVTHLGYCLYGLMFLGEEAQEVIPFESYSMAEEFLVLVDQLEFHPEAMNLLNAVDNIQLMFDRRPAGRY